MTLLQGDPSIVKNEGSEAVAIGAIGLANRSSQGDHAVSVSEYCAEKLQSLSDSDLRKSVNVGEESAAELLFGGESRGQVTKGESVGASGVGSFVISLAPVKESAEEIC